MSIRNMLYSPPALAMAVAVATLLAPAPASASAALSQKAGCSVCHQLDKKGLGPSYQQIAARYRGDANAAALMAQRVRQGSSGVWGKVPMQPVPTGKISDADLKSLVDWILAQ
jgi:cytochrome c